MPAVSPYLNHLWADAVWDVSGAFVHDWELVSFQRFCANHFGVRPIPIVHGAPLCAWNCGRVTRQLLCEPAEVRRAIETYAKEGMAVYATFTNMALEEQHLSDPMGNGVCTLLQHYNPTGRNAVIVASERLNTYLKKTYPGLRRVSSILHITNIGGRGKLEKYRELEEQFDEVMMHPDDVINYDLLEQIEHKERYILLVNEVCVRNCPLRPIHYRVESAHALDFLGHSDPAFQTRREANGCTGAHHLITSRDHGVMGLNTPEIAKLREMGFRHFKLQGRGSGTALPTLFDLLRLVLDNDSSDENAMHFIRQAFMDTLAPPL